MTIWLTLDLRTPNGGNFGTKDGGVPGGALVTLQYDRNVRDTSGAVPAPAQSPVVISGTVDPVVKVPYANDDAAVADDSQGFGIIVTARWRQGSTVVPWSRTVTIDSSMGDAVSLSDLADAQPVPPQQMTVSGVLAVANQAVSDAQAAESSAASSASAAAASAALVGAPAGDAIDAYLGHGSTTLAQVKTVANVKHFGAKGDGSTDDTSAIQSAATALATSGQPGTLYFPPGTYVVHLTEGQTLCTFTGATGIDVKGDRASLSDTTVYSNNGPFTNMFLFDGCKDVSVTGLQYNGILLTSPSTLLGYQGAILVRAINGTDGVRMDMRASNCRYGLQTGEYGDPSKGKCRNFDIKIRGSMIGYSIAAYYADGIKHDVDVAGVHRIVYVAGCNDVKGIARYSDEYIAQCAYVISDALIGGTDAAAQANPTGSPTSSRGSSNIDVQVQEMGSTQFSQSPWAAGISLSRVDPCTYRNIRVNVQTFRATDTTSTKVGAWIVNSTANGVWSRYAKNWSPSVVLEDIHVQVNADHSALTAPTANSDIYVSTYDGTTSNGATVRNMSISGTVKKSAAGNGVEDKFLVPGLTTGGSLSLDHSGQLAVLSSLAVPIAVSGKFNVINQANLAGGSPVSASNANITSFMAPSSGPNVYADGASVIAGSGGVRKVTTAVVTMSGATAYFASAIPANSLVLSVQTYVVTAITGATGYQVGVAGATNRYGDNLGITAGTKSNINKYLSTETSPRYYTSVTNLSLTAIGGSFTGGSVHVVITYDLYPDLAA